MTSHYTCEPVTTPLHDGGGVLGDSLWRLSFGPSQFPGHGSWLVCEVAITLSLSDVDKSFGSQGSKPKTLSVVRKHRAK